MSRWKSRRWALDVEDLRKVYSSNESKPSRWVDSHPISKVPGMMLQTIAMLSKDGPKWLLMVTRLLAFVATNTFAWPSLVRFYLSHPFVVHNVRYGPAARNYLDVYLPCPGDDDEAAYDETPETPNTKPKVPVVVMLTGGAWIIGYKAWFTLLILNNTKTVTLCHPFELRWRHLDQECKSHF